MSSRLASFRGPSTPNSTPVQHRAASSSTPSSPTPSRTTESTYHRKTRTLLEELRSIAETWDQLILVDGYNAASSLVNARTELNNALSSFPDRRPQFRIVTPQLQIMDQLIAKLDNTISKLHKQFNKMNLVIENMEALVVDAHKNKGWKWVEQEPLWTSWSLHKFASTVPNILRAYHRDLHEHISLVNILRSHSIPFKEAERAVARWKEQPSLEDSSWEEQWEDLCAAEVDRWNSSR